MRSNAIIIVGVGFQDPTQMHLAQDNDVVHTFTPDRSDQPFHKAILPGRGWCGRFVPDAHGAQSARDDAAIDPVAIADEVARSLIPGKRLRYLTCNPFGRGICCDVDPDEVSAVEPDNDEGIEQVETDSWNNEQVHGGDVRRVVAQEGSPSLAGRPPPFDHVLGDARLRDLKPELEQFTVNAWRAPKRIFDAHPPNQYAQLHIDPRSPSPSTRFPTPVAAKTGPMPTHELRGFCLAGSACPSLADPLHAHCGLLTEQAPADHLTRNCFRTRGTLAMSIATFKFRGIADTPCPSRHRLKARRGHYTVSFFWKTWLLRNAANYLFSGLYTHRQPNSIVRKH